MAKKVASIVKTGKEKNNKKSNEIFNLNEEIVIGINSKKVVTEKKKQAKTKKKNKSNNKSNNKKNNKNKQNFNNQKVKVKKKSQKILKIFIIIFLIIVATVLILLSPLFNINKITVKNNSKVSTEEIISLSGIELGINTFKYVNFDMIEKIKENPYIEDVKITRKYPTEIIIDITERTPEYFYSIGESFAYIDNQGYILDISNEEYNVPEILGLNTNMQNIILGARLVEKDLIKLEKIIEIYNYIKSNEIQDKVVRFVIDEDVIKLELQGDRIAYIEDFTNLNIKILSLKVILERTEGKSGEIILDGQGGVTSPVFREKV